jgi:UDP-glucuronate decarboxylase
MQRQPDISRARETLGWEPTIPLEEGLRRTIEYFERLLAASGRKRRVRGDVLPLRDGNRRPVPEEPLRRVAP